MNIATAPWLKSTTPALRYLSTRPSASIAYTAPAPRPSSKKRMYEDICGRFQVATGRGPAARPLSRRPLLLRRHDEVGAGDPLAVDGRDLAALHLLHQLVGVAHRRCARNLLPVARVLVREEVVGVVCALERLQDRVRRQGRVARGVELLLEVHDRGESGLGDRVERDRLRGVLLNRAEEDLRVGRAAVRRLERLREVQ